jgi:hypothetical protein
LFENWKRFSDDRPDLPLHVIALHGASQGFRHLYAHPRIFFLSFGNYND